jgi:predicted RNase H-like nuclease (RuvC/YqgF family)
MTQDIFRAFSENEKLKAEVELYEKIIEDLRNQLDKMENENANTYNT